MFNFSKELKSLFAKAMAGSNKVMEEGKQNARGDNAMNIRDQLRLMDGYSKKQKRMMLL